MATFVLSSCAGQLDDGGQAGAGIVGGQLDYGDPSVMLLVTPISDSEVDLCTATLVSPSFLLTAAHCTRNARSYIYSGTNHLSYEQTVIEHFVDPAWDPMHVENGHDAALVHVLGTIAGPIARLRTAPLGDADVGKPLRLVGYGQTADHADDAGSKRQTTAALLGVEPLLLSAGDATTNTCFGDSGGPAFLRAADGTEEIAGITSYGNSCRDVGYYTRVDTLGWLDSHLNPPMVQLPHPPTPNCGSPLNTTEFESNDYPGLPQLLCPYSTIAAQIEGPDSIDFFSWRLVYGAASTVKVNLPADYSVRLHMAWDGQEGWYERLGTRDAEGIQFQVGGGIGSGNPTLEIGGGAPRSYTVEVRPR